MVDIARLRELTNILNTMGSFRIDVFNGLKDSILVVKDGKIVDSNDAALEMYGYSREEFIWMDIKNIILNQDMHIRKDGSCFFVNTAVSKVLSGGQEFIVLAVRDITEFHTAIKLIKTPVLDKVLNSLPIGIWIIDGNGRIIYGNKKAKELWGGMVDLDVDNFNQLEAYLDGERIQPEQWASYRAFVHGEVVENQVVDIVRLDGKRIRITNSAYPIIVNCKQLGVVVVNYG